MKENNKKILSIIAAIVLITCVIAIIATAIFVSRSASKLNENGTLSVAATSEELGDIDTNNLDGVTANIEAQISNYELTVDQGSILPLDYEDTSVAVQFPDNLPDKIPVTYSKDEGLLTFDYEDVQFTVSTCSAQTGSAFGTEIIRNDSTGDTDKKILTSGISIGDNTGITVIAIMNKDAEENTAIETMTSLLKTAAPCSDIESISVQGMKVDTSYFDSVLMTNSVLSLIDSTGNEILFAAYDGSIKDTDLKETYTLKDGTKILSGDFSGSETGDKLFVVEADPILLKILVKDESILKDALGAVNFVVREE